jgi:hypothetical protein
MLKESENKKENSLKTTGMDQERMLVCVLHLPWMLRHNVPPEE